MKSKSNVKIKLLSFAKSDRAGKKYMVKLEKNGRTKTVHFGDSSMKDFTSFSPSIRASHKSRYLSRHAKREHWTDPTTAGFWSRWVLWGDSSSVKANLASTKRRFHL
jgi:hypothetical protein